jgi:hypothetical protein
MSELTDIAARIESVTHELRQRMDFEFQEATRVIRAEVEERMRMADDEWAAERQSLQRQIASLRNSGDRRELSTEIAQSEAALDQVRDTIDTMVNDPSVAISKLVRAKAREGELSAYLKGLKFKAEMIAAPTMDRCEVVAAGD